MSEVISDIQAWHLLYCLEDFTVFKYTNGCTQNGVLVTLLHTQSKSLIVVMVSPPLDEERYHISVITQPIRMI
jgi:hypothetical protein